MTARWPRRQLALACLAIAVTLAVASRADGVPYARQAELIAKVASYDKNFAARAGARVRILVLVKQGNSESIGAASQMMRALSDLADVGGLPVDATQEAYVGGEALAQTCRSRGIAIVYVTPGFAGDLAAIAAALTGGDVLSIAADPEYVPNRIVLGFDLVSGKPKLLVHLTQARQQNVAFKAEVLKLMKVYQ